MAIVSSGWLIVHKRLRPHSGLFTNVSGLILFQNAKELIRGTSGHFFRFTLSFLSFNTSLIPCWIRWCCTGDGLIILPRRTGKFPLLFFDFQLPRAFYVHDQTHTFFVHVRGTGQSVRYPHQTRRESTAVKPGASQDRTQDPRCAER